MGRNSFILFKIFYNKINKCFTQIIKIIEMNTKYFNAITSHLIFVLHQLCFIIPTSLRNNVYG